MSNATLEEPKQQVAQAAAASATPAAAPPAEPVAAAPAVVAPATPDPGAALDYDWRVPRRFVPAERRKLADLAANAARRIATDVGNLLRRQLVFEAGPVVEQYGAALWNHAEKPEYGVQLTDKAGRVCGMLSLPPQAAIGWVEQLLGGSAPADVTVKALSSLESALLLDIAAALVKAFSAASQEMGGPAFQHVENVIQEKSPIEGQEKEEFCRLAFVTQVAESRLEITLAVLSDLAAAVADPSLAKKKPRPPEELRKDLAGHLATTPVKVTAYLGKSTVTMRDVTVLEPGDVLLLSRTLSDPIELTVMGNLIHMGRPAACDGCYAIQIVERREWPRAKLQGKEPVQ